MSEFLEDLYRERNCLEREIAKLEHELEKLNSQIATVRRMEQREEEA